MKTAPSQPVALRLLAAVSLLILAGCGGGGGSDGTTAAAPPSSPPSSGAPNSTALKDNKAAAGASFNNFATATVRVPVDATSFVGTRRFVKLADAAGETLFLGEVAPGQPFSVPVNAPLGQKTFRYEIFTESAQDPVVRGEVTS